MFMSRLIVLLGLLGMAPLTSTWANETDGKATVGQAALAREVSESAAAGVLDAARTRKLLRAILLDTRTDPQEQDLVAELRRPGSEPVAVELPSGQTVQLPAPDTGGRALFDLFVQPVDLEALWLKDGESMVKLAEMGYWSGPVRRQIVAFVGSKYHEDWKVGAAISNGYQPLRGTLDKSWALIKDQDPVSRRLAAALLYDAMKEVDRARNDSLPDFLYNWLNPAGEFVRKGGQ
jgi:hypothetical protein